MLCTLYSENTEGLAPLSFLNRGDKLLPQRKTQTMTAENTSRPVDLNEETRSIWDQNASFWDDRMGDGNDFQRILIGPASERLLNLQPGETLLETACANGLS